FGLRYRAEEHPFLLSGGEKRRLSVGTALITRPRVIALDEPTFGQDRARAAELLDLLQDLQRAGTTIVIVTHDLDLVAAYATHTVVLADGELLAAGPTAEVLSGARPRNGGMAAAALAPSGTRPERMCEKVPVAQHPGRPSWDMAGGDAGGGDPVTEATPADPEA